MTTACWATPAAFWNSRLADSYATGSPSSLASCVLNASCLALGRPEPLPGGTSTGLGVALAIATLVMLFGLARGVEDALRERLLGTLPDRMKVQPASFHLGPMRLVDGLDEPKLVRLRALPGVHAVHEQARLSRPVQLRATYGEQSFWSDVVLEGADPGLVEPQLARGRSFDEGSEGPVPAVLPRVMMDVLAAGVSIHTDLPAIAPEMLAGRHFNSCHQSSFGAAAGPVGSFAAKSWASPTRSAWEVHVRWTSCRISARRRYAATPPPWNWIAAAPGSKPDSEMGLRLRDEWPARSAPGYWVRAVWRLWAAMLLVAAMSRGSVASGSRRGVHPGPVRPGASGRDLLALFLVRAGIWGWSGR